MPDIHTFAKTCESERKRIGFSDRSCKCELINFRRPKTHARYSTTLAAALACLVQDKRSATVSHRHRGAGDERSHHPTGDLPMDPGGRQLSHGASVLPDRNRLAERPMALLLPVRL